VIVWDDLIAELVVRGIGGWNEIEREMTLPRFYALKRCWRRQAGSSAPTDLSGLMALLGGPGPIR